MQDRKPSYLSGKVKLSTKAKGRLRNEPVWELRYRLPSGKQSDKILGKAWLKGGRPSPGYLTEAQAQVAGQRFLDEHSTLVPDDRKTFGRGCQDFLTFCITEKGLRGSTLHDYKRISETFCRRAWKEASWRERPLDSFTEADLIAVRTELTEAGRSADTLNHYRRIIRGAFGKEHYGRWTLAPNSPVHAWAMRSIKVEAEGTLRHYTIEEVERLIAAAENSVDAAIWTLATEAGPRQSEIRALLVRNVKFAEGVIVIERAFTTRGGLAGPKSHKVRSVPMSNNIRAALAPICAGKDGDALVFDRPELPGEPMCGVTMYRHLRSAAKRAGLPVLRFHDLRHTYGTMAVEVYPITDVQQYMGHSKIETTQRYTHYVAKPEAADKMSAHVASRRATTDNVVSLRLAS